MRDSEMRDRVNSRLHRPGPVARDPRDTRTPAERINALMRGDVSTPVKDDACEECQALQRDAVCEECKKRKEDAPPPPAVVMDDYGPGLTVKSPPPSMNARLGAAIDAAISDKHYR